MVQSAPPKVNEEDQKLIQDLQGQLLAKDHEHKESVSELVEKLDRYEKQINNVQNLNM